MPQQELTNHQRRFIYLPFQIFYRFTNIRELAVQTLFQKNGKLTTEFATKKTAEKYHERMRETDSWDKTILDDLEYTCEPGVEMVNPAIWSLSKREQKRVFYEISDYEKQFLFLPYHVFCEATNIRSLMKDSSSDSTTPFHKKVTAK